jgi:hypothetical protein
VSFYDERDSLWESIPAIEFLDFDERNQADYLFTQILDDVEFGRMRPQDSSHWDELKDLFGFASDGDVWDWREFEGWYEEAA